ncbi:phosphate ABC transporter permease PstA [Halobium salinum]|uniref:Phosphate transport system permease protein PstA n=1 Tax=Halobium salinum TaxID=1364940 RepID=A0ABD5P9B5_9EURY|nr:phosphate ABC transporter permease PstA [Halobium salinum]
MATDTNRIESFGTVSRTVGTAFRYLLLAATLFGIVMLAVFLVQVFNDAIQPLTADAGWHLTFLLTLVVPTVALSGYLYLRTPSALRLGAAVVGTLVVTLMFGAGLAMVFVDVVVPLVWLSYVVALAIPAVTVVGLEAADRRLPFTVRTGLTVAVAALSLLFVPGVVQTVPFVPTDWMIVALTIGGPLALVVAGRFGSLTDRRGGLAAGVVALGAVAVLSLLGPFVGIDPLPMSVLAAVAFVPTAAYAASAALSRPADRAGLALPVVVVGGAFLGAFVANLAGFAGPESWVDWQFLTSAHSSDPVAAGLYPAIAGSILLMVTVAALSFPLGVGAAVYLEEYAPDNRLTRLIDVNISNLAGVPSVVYGLLGLGVFVTYLGQSTGTVLLGGATLALLILPVVIISSREAIRSVPEEMRQASYGMGATRWQTVKNVILPRAFPGILTGTILSLGRAIGETAPLIMIGAPNVLFSTPTELSDKVSAMPLQVYSWATTFAGDDFYNGLVPAGVVVLLVVLLAMNSVAIVLRNKYQTEA